MVEICSMGKCSVQTIQLGNELELPTNFSAERVADYFKCEKLAYEYAMSPSISLETTLELVAENDSLMEQNMKDPLEKMAYKKIFSVTWKKMHQNNLKLCRLWLLLKILYLWLKTYYINFQT